MKGTRIIMKENRTDRKRLSDAFALLRVQGFDALKKEDRGLAPLEFRQVRTAPHAGGVFTTEGRLAGFGVLHCCADPRTRRAVAAALRDAGFVVFDRSCWDLGSIIFARDPEVLRGPAGKFREEVAAWPAMLEGLPVEALRD